jgi:hypothetical protein
MIQVLIFNSLVSELNNNDKGIHGFGLQYTVHEYIQVQDFISAIESFVHRWIFWGMHIPEKYFEPSPNVFPPHLEKFALPRNLNVHCII